MCQVTLRRLPWLQHLLHLEAPLPVLWVARWLWRIWTSTCRPRFPCLHLVCCLRWPRQRLTRPCNGGQKLVTLVASRWTYRRPAHPSISWKAPWWHRSKVCSSCSSDWKLGRCSARVTRTKCLRSCSRLGRSWWRSKKLFGHLRPCERHSVELLHSFWIWIRFRWSIVCS